MRVIRVSLALRILVAVSLVALCVTLAAAAATDGSTHARASSSVLDLKWPPTDPAWSPDGRRIAFATIAPNQLYDADVAVMRPDGSSARDLTRMSGWETSPSWSPDGARIAFEREPRAGANRDIYSMSLNGSGMKRLTSAPDWDREPAWSPDGRRIAFVSLRDGNQEIYVMDADGSHQTRLTSTPGPEFTPTWSPDSRQIAFVSGRGAGGALTSSVISVMRGDGSNKRDLTQGGGFDVTPAWAPDGRSIVFARSRAGEGSDLYVMNSDGGDQRRLTRDPGAESYPTWSPDSQRIAYTWTQASDVTQLHPALYVINADGTGRRHLVPSRARSVSAARVVFHRARKRSVPEGAPFHFSVVIRNPARQAVNLDVSFTIAGPNKGKTIAFTGSVVSIPARGKTRVVRDVTTGQWFRTTGPFKIRTLIDGHATGKPLTFHVGLPRVVVPRFKDVTASAGVVSRLPGAYCGDWAGAAWADVNGDGRLDLYLPRRGLPAQLWINHGNGRFSEEAARRGVDNGSAIGTGASFADYDNDGDPDLYVTNDGQSRLYRNDGHGFFTNVASAAGVANSGPASSAAWADYDNDGNLDLYVTAYVRCPSFVLLVPYADHLYHNNGNGTFTDETALLEHDPTRRDDGSTIGAGFQAAWFDYNGDGRQDLYLANDFLGSNPDRNHLWRNDGRGPDGKWRFTDVSVASGTSFSMNTMGIAIGDYNGDGRLDLALSNIEANKLLRNNGNGTFTDVAKRLGVGRPLQRVQQKSITWGTGFWDFNLDGWEDLYFAAGKLGYPEPQANELFANDRGRRFMDLSAPSRANNPATGRGVAFGDYDRDGRMDLFVVNIEGSPRLYRNVTPRAGRHWLEVDTVGTRSNRDGCGTFMTARVGGHKLVREVFCGSTSLSSGSDVPIHFGLGRSRVVSRLSLRWPSGETQVLKNVKADHMITVVEPRGR